MPLEIENESRVVTGGDLEFSATSSELNRYILSSFGHVSTRANVECEYELASAGTYIRSPRETSNKFEETYIHSFNYRPDKFNFNSLPNDDNLYLGVELEIDEGGEDGEVAHEVSKILNKYDELIYCMHDGSLKKGFEIAVHPSTLNYHNQINYDEAFNYLTNKGYRSHDTKTCGLHVHINRNYFGDKKLEQDLCISKLLYLYEKFWDKVEIVARRKSNGYANRFLLEENDSPLDLYSKSKNARKYGAINLMHEDTVEIRIFKGTLNLDTYLCTLEFVDKMARIAKEVDIYDIQLVTWDYIMSNFSNKLVEYIKDRTEKAKIEDEVIKNGVVTTLHSNGTISSMQAMDIRLEPLRSPDLRSMYGVLERLNGSVDSNEVVNQDECTLLRKIKNKKKEIRRARNGLEETNLRRELADLENELRILRRDCRRN